MNSLVLYEFPIIIIIYIVSLYNLTVHLRIN